jgi:gamma-glutamylcyclotransferase (GGCT)/AIG2-like uncharacterized protein YtfP
MKKDKIFLYGTLKNSRVLRSVLGRSVPSTVTVLDGYKKTNLLVNGERYPLIIPDPNSQVGGLLVEITESDLKELDQYGANINKQRQRIVLNNGIKAWVYLKV